LDAEARLAPGFALKSQLQGPETYTNNRESRAAEVPAAPPERSADVLQPARDGDLPRVRFHDLRHSAASLRLASGVQLAEVSKLLGHSELRLTADLYSHLQQETAAKAARIMDGLLRRS
jgi:integrase